MKKVTSFLIALFCTAVLQAQSAREVDSIVKLYPKTITSVVRLSERIKKDFTTDFGKARAIYTWIALNISYDDQLLEKIVGDESFAYHGTEKQIDDSVINQVLVKRKAVCDGYSRLFNRLATLSGLETEIIHGFAKTVVADIGDDLSKTNHAWNIVKIDGKWRLIDVTWGSGSSMAGRASKRAFTSVYFDTSPEVFFLNHYPENGQWQDMKIDKQTFANLPVFYFNEQNATYVVKEPRNGIINASLGQKIKFSIVNAKAETSIYYTMNQEEESTEVTEKKEVNSVLEFEIVLDKNTSDNLTIYIGENGFACYKLLYK